MNKKNQKTIILSILVLVLSLTLVFFQMSKKQAPVQQVTQTPSVVTEKPPVNWTQKEWADNYAINRDYVGTLRFESGLMNQDIVQGVSNDTYLRTNWKTMEFDAEGTSFLDAASVYRTTENIQEDKNIVMYGHYVYPEHDPSQTHMFTPLHVLKDKENYEKNRYVDFLMENEVRRYQVTDVFYVELLFDQEEKEYLYTPDTMEYYYPHFTPEYLETYKKEIQNSIKHFGVGYSSEVTGIDISEKDQLLTLQTCVENHDELRLIVICKEVGRYPINK